MATGVYGEEANPDATCILNEKHEAAIPFNFHESLIIRERLAPALPLSNDAADEPRSAEGLEIHAMSDTARNNCCQNVHVPALARRKDSINRQGPQASPKSRLVAGWAGGRSKAARQSWNGPLKKHSSRPRLSKVSIFQCLSIIISVFRGYRFVYRLPLPSPLRCAEEAASCL